MPNTNAKSDYTNNQVAETVNVLHIYVKSRWIGLKLNCTNLSLELHISDVELHILCRTAHIRKNPVLLFQSSHWLLYQINHLSFVKYFYSFYCN